MLLRVIQIILLFNFFDLAHRHFKVDMHSAVDIARLVVLVLSLYFVKDLWIAAKKAKTIYFDTLSTLKLSKFSQVGVYLITGVFALHAMHALAGITVFPITSVEMFKGASDNVERPNYLVRPKYYYVDEQGETQILEPRKEHVWPINDCLGWGYNQEFTFSIWRDLQYKKETYDLLSKILKPCGADTLLVGYHVFDYAADKATFYKDISQVPASGVFYFNVYDPADEK